MLESLYESCVQFHQIQKDLLQHNINNDQENNVLPPVNAQADVEEETKELIDNKEPDRYMEVNVCCFRSKTPI